MSEKLEAVLEKIVNKLDELDKRISKLESGKTEKKAKKKTGTIKTSKFTMDVNKARKGVGIAIKFEKFVKVENNAVYVVLSEDEARNLIRALYREVSNVLNGTKKTYGKVKIVEE